jgi:hypothetical protein
VLNELYQVVAALDARGVSIVEQHRSLTPMGKNDPLLVVELNETGAPSNFSLATGEIAGKLLRICHGSQGSSFPGFNLPTPLRTLPAEDDRRSVEQMTESRRKKGLDGKSVATRLTELFTRSRPAPFKPSQCRQFSRSVNELVGWLRDDLEGSAPELTNFLHLLEVVANARLELPQFAERLGEKLATAPGDLTMEERVLVGEWLFTTRKLPVYLECEVEDVRYCRVVDVRMGELINARFLAIDAKPYDSKTRAGVDAASAGCDAYTGVACEIPDSFPTPKLALLGNVRLFSNNTDEAQCFFRYGLGGSNTFNVSKLTAQRMAGALRQLASEDQLNRTCRAIPSNRAGQQDLLIAYLEDEPDAPDPYVDLFGSEAPSFDAPDFAAVAKPVLDALAGRVAANPNQLIRLFAISSLDKANKQVSLNRSFTVREVTEAAHAWQAGAANCPPVRIPFFDRQAKKLAFRERTTPSPLEVAVILNKVWVSDPNAGFRPEFQRIIAVSDAYDTFIAPAPLRQPSTRFALQTLLARMRNVFAGLGRLKVTFEFNALSEQARWQVLRAVALIGIFLDQLGQRYEVFMRDSIYQVGRLLSLADSLHFQYCKWVRTSEHKRKSGSVDAPSELLGNSLFNFALDNPVAALARLAERIRPYKGWADTYTSEDAGLIRWFVRQMAECERQLDSANLPARMEDVHKAQLLLGYLADHPKSQAKEE